MKVRFVYPKFNRHAEAHPELRRHVPCNEYFGPPSLGIACLAAVTPPSWEIDFRDDRLEDVGLDDDDVDLVALSFFTPSAKRGMELGDAFRARGKKVVMGGIFPTMMPADAGMHADAVVMGEGDGVWPALLRDVELGELKPRYSSHAPVDLSTLPLPRVDLYMDKENTTFSPDDYPVQTSRGCPLNCTACVLPDVMGRRMRYYDAAHVKGQIEALEKRGKLGSFTEDTAFFHAANKCFMAILDSYDGAAPISYLGVSMPMILATSSDVLTRMRRAGIRMFYLVGGFDPVTRKAFSGTNPQARQQACDAVRKAKDHGIEPYTSFLVGNDEDDEGVFDRMLDFANDTNIEKAEFAIMTPYPGTPSYKRLASEDRILTRDWSLYNDANVVFRPAKMTPERLLDGYLQLWREFYRPRQSLKDREHRERTIQF